MLRFLLNRSIKTKIVWSTVLISLIPLLILSYLFYDTNTRSLERTMLRSSNQNADYLSDYLDKYFQNVSASALQVYGFQRIMNLMEHGIDYNDPDILNLKDSLNNYYRLVESRNEHIMKVMIYGKNNRLADNWSRASSYDAITLGKGTPYFDEMLDLPFQNTLMFTYTESQLKQSFFVYGVTIYDPFSKSKVGTLIFYIPSKEIVKMVERYNYEPNEIILQNRRGDTFYQTSDRFAASIDPYEPPKLPISSQKHDLRFSDNKDRLTSTSFINNGNIRLSIVYPNTELRLNRDHLMLITIVALILVLLFIYIFSFLSQRFITRPLLMLGKAMKAFRNGNLQATVKQPLLWRDDISELTRSFNYMTEKIRTMIETEFQMQLRNKEAHIMALQMQINPHFLYNTLQTIGGKAVLMGDYEIHEMCRALGDMFRYSFYEGNMKSTLRMELVHVNNYLYIQQLRFENSLRLEIDVPETFMDVTIIRFVLQPIIENVIVHGLVKDDDTQLLIRISAVRESNDIVLTVWDNGPGMDKGKLEAVQMDIRNKSKEVFAGVSIGLKNVHERIKLVYGPKYGITIYSEEGSETSISIRIPNRMEAGENVQSDGRG
ncbi:sensor histidine kinase [Paenibacillus paridis]|uniref:sensor histidine kinase n=1 Tax=Paenibacillus paridis TaxID=2583376 RepID=UPI00111DB4C2|nr:sensor histidine kinase [Paenibacillus paridis]